MFEQLRKALSSATRNIIHRELTEKDLTKVLSELEIALLQSDIPQEVIDVIVTKLKSELIGTKLEKEQNAANIVQIKFRNAIVEMFSRSGEVDLVKKIIEKKDKRGGPFIVVFLGINGTGKTTTVAKVAHFLRKHNISVVLAAGDTHRAGAIEQISLHAEKLSLKVITQRYGADPSAVGRDAIDYAKKHHIDVVLVDTAGRMQTARNLMDEISKIVRVVKPDIKLFVGDALAGNDTINQAREFFQYTNFDGALLTKIDADAKGGAAISIVHITSKPIIFLGVGQGYDDLVSFDAERFIDSIFRDTPLADAQTKIPYPFSEKGQSIDSLVENRQQLENPRTQELTEEAIMSGNESAQLGDLNIEKEKEKQRISQSQHGLGNSASSPSLENVSTAPDDTQQAGLSTGTEKHANEERVKEIMNTQADHLVEREQDPNSSFSTHSIRAKIDHSDNVNSYEEKNKKTRFGGLLSKWKKTRNEQKENLARDRSEKENGQKGNVDVVGESRSKYENKDKENLDYNKSHPGGEQETKRSNHHENKD